MNSRRVAHFALPLDQLAQPGDALIVVGGPLLAFLVFPVRGDAFLGQAVHLFGADLDFEGQAAGADHGGVQRLVQVGPRDGDEVLDAAGNGMPLVVDHAERGVAVLDRIGDDAQGQQIVDLVDADLLALHLLVDRVGALDAAFDAGGNAFARQVHFDVVLDLLQRLLRAPGAWIRSRGPVRRRLRARGIGTRGPPVRRGSCPCRGGGRWGRRFRASPARCAPAARAAEQSERAHVVQPVRQLDDDDADVGDHGQQHLADALGLALLARIEVQLAELGDAVDAAGHLVAELLADLIEADCGVFDDVVQQAGFEADHVHLHVRQDQRDLQGMDHVGLARGFAELRFVGVGG